MRALMTIGILLIVVLLGVTVLDKLGASEVTDKMGAFVKEKAGVASSAAAAVGSASKLPGKNGTEEERARYLKTVLGWDLRDLRNKPLETVRAGQRHVAAEIERLENLSQVLYAEIISNRKLEASTSRDTEEKKQLLQAAKAALMDPATQYPVKIGMYEYDRETLIAVAGDTKHWLDSHGETASISGGNLTTYAQTAYTSTQETLDMLYSAQRALKAKEDWFRVEELYNDAETARKAANELDVVVKTILNPRERGRKMPFETPAKVDNDERILEELREWNGGNP